MKKITKLFLALGLAVALLASPALQVTETSSETVEKAPLQQADPGGTRP